MLLGITMLLVLPAAVTAYYYNGDYFTGTYLRIGVNDYGVLGIQDATLGDIGFQYPIGSGYESLAVGWWGGMGGPYSMGRTALGSPQMTIPGVLL